MSITSIERGQTLPPLIADLRQKREMPTIIDEFSQRVPLVLHPHLPGYLTDLATTIASPAISTVLTTIEGACREIPPLKEKILKLLPEQNGDLERQIAELKRKKSQAAKRPEPLPTTLKPAMGRLARTLLNVALGLNLPRPDLEALDREITLLGYRKINCKNLAPLQEQSARLDEIIRNKEEELLVSIDLWAVDALPRTLIHLALNPDRLIKIIKAYQKRALKDPSPEEAIWYVTWILSNIKGLNGKNGLLSQMPETSQNWFKSLFPHIQSPSMALSIFEKSIEEFRKPNWSLLTPSTVNPETLEHVNQALNSSLKVPGFSAGVRDFSSFVQWAFVASAQNLGIFPEDEPVPPPIPEVCELPSEKPKQRKGKQIVEPEPASPERSRGVEKEERQFPVICVSPHNSDKQLFLNPNGTVRLITAKKEIITNLTEEAVATVFNLKPQDPRAKMIWENLQRFQRRFYGFSRAGDIQRLNRPVFQGQFRADYKIRFGNWVLLFSLDKGQEGIPTYIITAFGSHNEVYGR